MNNVTAEEWDAAARAELQAHPFPPKCIFADIANFLLPHLQPMLSNWKTQSCLESELKAHVVNNKAIKTKAYCVVHSRLCSISEEPAEFHCAGTPCTAHSAMGDREEANSMPYGHFLTWCGQRREIQEETVVQECTDGFPRDPFTEVLDMYDWNFVVLSPHQVGFPVQRTRQWALFHGLCTVFFLQSNDT